MLHPGTNEADELVRQFGNPCPSHHPPQQPDCTALKSFDVFSISNTFLLKTNKCEPFFALQNCLSQQNVYKQREKKMKRKEMKTELLSVF